MCLIMHVSSYKTYLHYYVLTYTTACEPICTGICISAYLYVYIKCVCTHVYVSGVHHVHAHLYIPLCVSMCTRPCVPKCTHVCTLIYECVYLCKGAYMCAQGCMSILTAMFLGSHLSWVRQLDSGLGRTDTQKSGTVFTNHQYRLLKDEAFCDL